VELTPVLDFALGITDTHEELQPHLQTDVRLGFWLPVDRPNVVPHSTFAATTMTRWLSGSHGRLDLSNQGIFLQKSLAYIKADICGEGSRNCLEICGI
jgi:hypothetical protein